MFYVHPSFSEYVSLLKLSQMINRKLSLYWLKILKYLVLLYIENNIHFTANVCYSYYRAYV